MKTIIATTLMMGLLFSGGLMAATAYGTVVAVGPLSSNGLLNLGFARSEGSTSWTGFFNVYQNGSKIFQTGNFVADSLSVISFSGHRTAFITESGKSGKKNAKALAVVQDWASSSLDNASVSVLVDGDGNGTYETVKYSGSGFGIFTLVDP